MFPTPKKLVGQVGPAEKVSAPLNNVALVASVQNHWWVEAYLPGQGWQDLDPSLTQGTVGQRLAGDAQLATDGSDRIAEVPDALRHKITMRLKIEQMPRSPAGRNCPPRPC